MLVGMDLHGKNPVGRCCFCEEKLDVAVDVERGFRNLMELRPGVHVFQREILVRYAELPGFVQGITQKRGAGALCRQEGDLARVGMPT